MGEGREGGQGEGGERRNGQEIETRRCGNMGI